MGYAPAGWDQQNWDDPNMHSVKYDSGRMLQGARSINDVDNIVRGQQFQSRFPGATFDGKDHIDYKGALSDQDHGSPVYTVDVLAGADPTTGMFQNIWWGPDDVTGGSALGGEAVNHKMTPAMPGSSDLMTQILQSLQSSQQQSVDPQQMLLDALR